MVKDEAIVLLAESLASLDLDEELERHPELVKHKDSILQFKIAEYERQLETNKKKNEQDIRIAGELIQTWFNALPKESQERFSKELNSMRQMAEKKEFVDDFLDSVFNPEPISLQKFFHLSDGFIDVLFKEGHRLQEAGHYVEAICLNKFLILFNPQLVGAYRALGYSYFCVGELEEAQKFFDLSIALAPEDPKSYYLSAVCSKERKEEQNAKVFCEAGLELSSSQPEWEKMFQDFQKSLSVRG